MRVKEQLLMSYLIDQSNLAKLLAKLSKKEASLFEEDLRQLLDFISRNQTLLTGLLTSENDECQLGLDFGD